MELPKTPFTMAEFVAKNGLGRLGKNHFNLIRKRFTELGLVQVRRRREKTYAENVWVKEEEAQEAERLEEKLKELRLN
jgi:hypothetical protein